MDAAKHAADFDRIAGFRDLIQSHVKVDDGFFTESSAAEIADDFPENPRIAVRDVAGLFRLQFNYDLRGVIARQLVIKRGKVCTLRCEHLIPLLAWRTGVETIVGLFPRGVERLGFARLHE